MSGRPDKLVLDMCWVQPKDTKSGKGTGEGHKGKLFTWQDNDSLQYRMHIFSQNNTLAP